MLTVTYNKPNLITQIILLHIIQALRQAQSTKEK